ncbi:hypothetical protein LEMLEM_LOCUS10191 [Lemmus lemmus]
MKFWELQKMLVMKI